MPPEDNCIVNDQSCLHAVLARGQMSASLALDHNASLFLSLFMLEAEEYVRRPLSSGLHRTQRQHRLVLRAIALCDTH